MVDLQAEYRAMQAEIDAALHKVLESGRFVLGPNVTALEEEVADYLGVAHAVALASGTDALHLALRASGIVSGDEVITTPFTFIATATAILHAGAVPVFVDVDPATFNIDPQLVAAAITGRTRAILPVHLYGQAADLGSIMNLARHHGLRVIEDCAQSFGARYGSRRTGSIGDVGCFSFYPTKNLSAFGDGGMAVTNDEEVAATLRLLRDHGSTARHRHVLPGFNSRLDELQAAVLRVKLSRIDRNNDRRRQFAAHYTRRLMGTAVMTPGVEPGGDHVFHQYTVRVSDRTRICTALEEAGIDCAIHYPVPLHKQPACAVPGLSLPQAEAAADHVLSLPMHPYLTMTERERVCDVLIKGAGAG